MINNFTSRHKKEWSGREIDASQAERLGRSCFSFGCSVLSFARSAQAEPDIESLSDVFSSKELGTFVSIADWFRLKKKIRIKTVFTDVLGGMAVPPPSRARTILYWNHRLYNW